MTFPITLRVRIDAVENRTSRKGTDYVAFTLGVVGQPDFTLYDNIPIDEGLHWRWVQVAEALNLEIPSHFDSDGLAVHIGRIFKVEVTAAEWNRTQHLQVKRWLPSPASLKRRESGRRIRVRFE